MKLWIDMKLEERVEYLLEYFSQDTGRYSVLYKGRTLWFGNKPSYKTEGIAKRQVYKHIRANVPFSKPVLDKLFDDKILTIKKYESNT